MWAKLTVADPMKSAAALKRRRSKRRCAATLYAERRIWMAASRLERLSITMTHVMIGSLSI